MNSTPAREAVTDFRADNLARSHMLVVSVLLSSFATRTEREAGLPVLHCMLTIDPDAHLLDVGLNPERSTLDLDVLFKRLRHRLWEEPHAEDFRFHLQKQLGSLQDMTTLRFSTT